MIKIIMGIGLVVALPSAHAMDKNGAPQEEVRRRLTAVEGDVTMKLVPFHSHPTTLREKVMTSLESLSQQLEWQEAQDHRMRNLVFSALAVVGGYTCCSIASRMPDQAYCLLNGGNGIQSRDCLTGLGFFCVAVGGVCPVVEGCAMCREHICPDSCYRECCECFDDCCRCDWLDHLFR